MLSTLTLLLLGIAATTHGAYLFEKLSDPTLDVETLFYELIDQSPDEADLIRDMLKSRIFIHYANCSGDVCKLCGQTPLGEFCIEVTTPNDTVTFELTKSVFTLLSMEFVNKLPEICAFKHLCIQLTEIELKNGQLCFSLEYARRPVFKELCFRL